MFLKREPSADEGFIRQHESCPDGDDKGYRPLWNEETAPSVDTTYATHVVVDTSSNQTIEGGSQNVAGI